MSLTRFTDQLRDMAAQVAAEANGELGRAWEIFVPRFIAATGEIVIRESH